MENEFHKRKLAPRLNDFDYSTDGAYFITTCTQNRENFFGKIENEKIVLNNCAKIVREKWLWLSKQYPYLILDEFVVMPNHFHGILIIDSIFCNDESGDFCRGGSRPTPTKTQPTPTKTTILAKNKIKPLTKLIGAFKTVSSKEIHLTIRPDFRWQRSFHDHIIRDEDELNRIRDYIRLNPAHWTKDKNLHNNNDK